MIHSPHMLTVKVVAEMLSVSERYVRTELIHGGKIKAMRFKPRGPWRLFADSVSRLIDHASRHERSEAFYVRRAEAAMARLGFAPPRERDHRAPGRKPGR